jgi:hypothetical protein
MATSTRRATLVHGAAAGVLAYLASYLVTWVLAGSRAGSLFVSGPFGGDVPDWKALLWVFYDSHFVGTRTPGLVGPGGERLARSGLVDTVALLDAPYLYAVPVVVLLAAGATVALRTGVDDPRSGLEAGLTVVLGYAVLAVLGMMVAQQAGVGPSPLRAAVVAGLLYPVAFGGVGGAVVGALAADGAENP